tara:strand:- start:351 stop:545 length:195 start_codon:yes stop_codon:yes gene_type:complete
MQQDPSTYSSDSQSKFVEDWEANIEKIERNRKIMREGAEAVKIYKNLGLMATEGYNIRRIDKIP